MICPDFRATGNGPDGIVYGVSGEKIKQDLGK
jgi:hypothetical protein